MKLWAAIAWMCVAIGFTVPEFLTQINFFRHPGEQYFRALMVLLAAAPLLFAMWHGLHRRLWRLDPALLVGLPLALAAFYESRATVVALVVLAACHAAGSFARKRLGIESTGVADRLVLNWSLGFGALHCLLFGLGLCGLYHPWVFATLLLTPLLLLWRETAELAVTWREMRAGWSRMEEAGTLAGSLLVAAALVFEALAAIVAVLPSTAFDVLKMHLPSAQYYAAQHALRPVPGLDYSYFPQSSEALMTLGIAFAGQAGAQLLAALFFPLAMLAVWCLLRACGIGLMGAFAGSVCAAAVPAIHWAGSAGKNDLTVAFFVLAALLGFLRRRAGASFRWMQWGAFCVAMAAGVKHTLLFSLPGILLLYLYGLWRERNRLRAALSLAAIVVVFGFLWHARTAYLTGNPLHPMKLSAAVSSTDLQTKTVGVLSLLRRPWDLHFQGDRYFESILHAPLGIVLLLSAPVWLLARSYGGAAGASLLFAALSMLYWYSSLSIVRYVVAALLVLLALAAARSWEVYASSPKLARASLFVGATYALLFAACGTAILEINGPALRYLARATDKQDYLREALGTYPSLAFLRERWQPGDCVVSMGNWSTAYAPDPLRFFAIGDDKKGKPLSSELWRNCRYLILPVSKSRQGVAARGREVHRDANFTVFLVEPADPAR